MAVAIATIIMILANGVVGVSLLRVAARTRKAPELLIGLGLTAMGPVSQVCTVLAGVGRLPAGEVHLPLHVVSIAASSLGMACIFLFVRKVFRPHETWARKLTSAAIGALVVSGVANVLVIVKAPPAMPSTEALRVTGAIVIVLFTAAFGWACLEAGLYFARLRRQVALGLADPVVANRFLLWTIATGAAFLLGLFLVSVQLRGEMLSLALVPSVTICVVSVITGTGMYLAFLPPQKYVAWVQARAQQAAA